MSTETIYFRADPKLKLGHVFPAGQPIQHHGGTLWINADARVFKISHSAFPHSPPGGVLPGSDDGEWLVALACGPTVEP